MRRTLLPGFRFRNGRLTVTTQDAVRVLGCWPELQAVIRFTDQRVWRQYVPTFRLLRPKAAGDSSADLLGPAGVKSEALHGDWEKQMAVAQFRHAIPPAVAQAVERFTNRQWGAAGDVPAT